MESPIQDVENAKGKKLGKKIKFFKKKKQLEVVEGHVQELYVPKSGIYTLMWVITDVEVAMRCA
ncbi:hypothetical protein GOP47_0026186 [Adiantum capillus-veneris]|nr:hypothetical protein GOP47_0026186 [Adiantum capillus-veneris]